MRLAVEVARCLLERYQADRGIFHFPSRPLPLILQQNWIYQQITRIAFNLHLEVLSTQPTLGPRDDMLVLIPVKIPCGFCLLFPWSTRIL